MNKILFFSSLLFLFVACKENNNSNGQVTIHIKGMMCTTACGPKIQKELYELDCVKKVNINFVGIDEDNTAIVSYEPSVCNYDDFKKKIEQINGGNLYEVTNFSE